MWLKSKPFPEPGSPLPSFKNQSTMTGMECVPIMHWLSLPHNAQIGRPDEVLAARHPVVRWQKG